MFTQGFSSARRMVARSLWSSSKSSKLPTPLSEVPKHMKWTAVDGILWFGLAALTVGNNAYIIGSELCDAAEVNCGGFGKSTP